MWEPFTEQAKRTIVLAQEAAQHLGTAWIGTEHLLLGILSRNESGAELLRDAGVTYDSAFQHYRAIFGEPGTKRSGEMVFSAGAKRAIELAFTQARELNHRFIGEEHLLLAILREGDPSDAVIAPLTARYDEVRARVIEKIPPGKPAEEAIFQAIDHVQLAMPPGQEGRAREFYAGILGMQERPKPEDLAKRGGVWFESGSVHLHLGADPDFRAGAKAHVALHCRDYDALVNKLANCGVTVKRASPLPGDRAHSYVHDPFGNRIELLK